MMMIDDVVVILRAKDHRHHVMTKKFGTLFLALLAPAATFGFYLAHPDGDLGWAELSYWNGSQDRRTNRVHAVLPAETPGS